MPRSANIEIMVRAVTKAARVLTRDFNEVDDPAGMAQDATQWTWFVHAQHAGGVSVRISEPGDIDKAMPLIRQAHAVASA